MLTNYQSASHPALHQALPRVNQSSAPAEEMHVLKHVAAVLNPLIDEGFASLSVDVSVKAMGEPDGSFLPASMMAAHAALVAVGLKESAPLASMSVAGFVTTSESPTLDIASGSEYVFTTVFCIAK